MREGDGENVWFLGGNEMKRYSGSFSRDKPHGKGVLKIIKGNLE